MQSKLVTMFDLGYKIMLDLVCSDNNDLFNDQRV